SKDAELWGAFDYKQEHDALRIQAKPEAADFSERMLFTFEDTTDTSTKVVLRWEKLRVPFTVEADTTKLTMDRAREAVRWQAPYQVANYCIQNNTCLDEAGRYLDASIAIQEAWPNLRAKALYLAKKGDTKGAVIWGEKALAVARTAQQPPAAQQVKELEGMIADWKKK
ncbi:MAG TPA: DUF2911 domain-containing protein, partial [Thermoanaerobaculia bacterium]|nr:DUF2911 domain-containing protein [Thermoanaerobaculia bacterium]